MQKIPYLALALFFLIADQLSKWAVTEYVIRPMSPDTLGNSYGLIEWFMQTPERLPFAKMTILPFFNIVMVWNQGVSFGMFNGHSDYGPMILTILAVLIIILFTVWLFKTENKLHNFAVSMVIGGALGNLIDRARFGAVIDFLDFHVMGWHWPAFNVSDSCICIGVFLLIIQSFFFEKSVKSAT